ncbi:hypothetical protein C2G38_2189370 [Gigaspora rosea]|uniref:F-box domain-containing protein n=1 Tax=Gigaspora rosea TaxID=44941 RepID=A0A397V2K5_9GLOM|nr:hypothetical protein C2G38_2189370 [Gigaspora rosea]
MTILDGLLKYLNKIFNLTSLNINSIRLCTKGMKTLLENNFWSKEGKALTDTLCKNNALTSLDFNCNGPGSKDLGLEGGKVLTDALARILY